WLIFISICPDFGLELITNNPKSCPVENILVYGHSPAGHLSPGAVNVPPNYYRI
ncbi:unnamed protein product, partial [marine sediment metagenome]